MENPQQNPARSRAAAFILAVSMVFCAGLALKNARTPAGEDVQDPQSAPEWMARASLLEQHGDPAGAERALRAALARDPWHPGAVRRLTELLLQQGDDAALALWMEDLLLGDARLAEQNFLFPAFAPKREQPPFQAIFREARIQARD